jgi:DNA-binding MarR family transcriptional regulator
MYMHIKDGLGFDGMKLRGDELDLTGTRGCAAFNLRRASRAITALYDAALAPAGLRSTQFAILVAVAKLQPASVNAIAEVTVSDQTTMTRNLKPLVRDGLIELSARGAKREKRVMLTAKGRRVLAKATPAWRAQQARFVDTFGVQNWREVRTRLEAMAGLAVRHSKS